MGVWFVMMVCLFVALMESFSSLGGVGENTSSFQSLRCEWWEIPSQFSTPQDISHPICSCLAYSHYTSPSSPPIPSYLSTFNLLLDCQEG